MRHQHTSAQQAEQRRMRLLSLLHTRPHTREEILAFLEQEHLFPDDHAQDAGVRAKRQYYLFRHDLDLLRACGWQIVFQRESRSYVWQNSPFAFSLLSEQLPVFAVLIDTFASLTIPHADELRSLLSALASRLPEEQREALRAQRRTFGILVQETSDYQRCDPATVRTIERAIQLQQQLEFRYRSRDGIERRHIIEPSPWFLKDGHAYFKGWSLEYAKTLNFRLDYVVAGSARILPTRSQQNRPRPRVYALEYTLDATIARNNVSEHFPRQQVVWHANGAATVTAQITDLFEAERILLGYGEHCVVSSPPELVERLRLVATHFAQTYLT